MEASRSGQRAWPATEIVHEGIARAEFSDPSGWVRGPVSVQVDEQGHLDVEMQVEEACLEEESYGYSEAIILLSGCRPHLASTEMVLQFSIEPRNTCKTRWKQNRVFSEQVAPYFTLSIPITYTCD